MIETKHYTLLFLILASVFVFDGAFAQSNSQLVPIDGNTWQVSGKNTRYGGITKAGIQR